MVLDSTDCHQQQLTNSIDRALMIIKLNFNKQDSLISKLLQSIIKAKRIRNNQQIKRRPQRIDSNLKLKLRC